jgi:hypothetical protein
MKVVSFCGALRVISERDRTDPDLDANSAESA